ncbi:MAG: response regulator [Lachnospiraceae bacterium]|nr:response regulator [Lachnospiraceae bacterium]
MKSIQTKIIVGITALMIMVAALFLITAISRTKSILDNDSETIMGLAADANAGVVDEYFGSLEQSVDAIYKYALQNTGTYDHFLEDQGERDLYTGIVANLGKSIAENTKGAMSVYLRYNPDDYGPTSGFWYTSDLDGSAGKWVSAEPTDLSLYAKDDVEHVGWYYIPIAKGTPMWMDPYFNKNLSVEMISYIIPYYFKGYTVGIIGMDIDISLLCELVSRMSVYETGRAFLVTRNGDLIYHEKHPAGIKYNDMDDELRSFVDTILKSDPAVSHNYTGDDNVIKKLELRELRNGMIMGVYAPISEIKAPQDKLLSELLIVSGIILVIAVMFSLLWVKSITEPLQRMTRIAQEYENLNFEEVMDTDSEDEVGTLARSMQSMAASLKQQIERADKASKAKSDFLASMSHEIRTPINAVLGMNQMILRESRDPSILEYAGNIQSSGKTLLTLINSILDFSNIEDGKMEIQPIKYELSSVINNLVNSISERVKAKSLEFVVNVDNKLPSVLFGDDVRIEQIIYNLLTNAVKYTNTGAITLNISESIRHDNFVVLAVSVEDTGIGIKKEDMAKMFDTFERLDETRNRNVEGTGLGMSIVTKLLNMMESELHVNSVYGQGSVFSFYLKQEIKDATPIGNYTDRLETSRASENEKTVLHAPEARILVVDDNEMNLKVASNLMKIFGITPRLAVSGEEAIDLIDTDTFDIVFLDHMMPKMDGIETLERLREKHDTLPPIIALTANAVVGAKEMYLSKGFIDYMSKPIDLSTLQEKLVKYLPPEIVSYVTENKEVKKPSSKGSEKKSATIKKDSSGTDSVKTGSSGGEVIEFSPKGGNDDVLEFAPSGPQSPDDAPLTFEPGDEQIDDSAFGEDKLEQLKKLGFDTDGALGYCAGDSSFYEELLEDFVASRASKSDELSGYHADGDLDSYRTLVHSLKSSAKTIGAMELSEMAKQLEFASRDGKADFVDEHHEPFIAAYKNTTEQIQSVVGC